MSATELQRWWLYAQIEPWGELRADLRMGILASSLVNMWISKGQKTKPSDFIPDFLKASRPPRKRQTPQEMFAILKRGTEMVQRRSASG